MGRIKKFGVFGGTFDPPHYGHLIMAEAACDYIDLDMVLWVPTGRPPHKQDQSYVSIEHRLAMVKLALSGNKKFKVSLIDVNRPGPHYTVDTLQHLAERFRRVEFYLILGSDSLNDMLTWHRPDEIVRQAHLAIVERPEHPANLSNIAEKMSSLLARIIQVPCPQIAISSSRIRENAAKGRTIRYLLPDRVRTYIHQHRLYQA